MTYNDERLNLEYLTIEDFFNSNHIRSEAVDHIRSTDDIELHFNKPGFDLAVIITDQSLIATIPDFQSVFQTKLALTTHVIFLPDKARLKFCIRDLKLHEILYAIVVTEISHAEDDYDVYILNNVIELQKRMTFEEIIELITKDFDNYFTQIREVLIKPQNSPHPDNRQVTGFVEPENRIRYLLCLLLDCRMLEKDELLDLKEFITRRKAAITNLGNRPINYGMNSRPIPLYRMNKLKYYIYEFTGNKGQILESKNEECKANGLVTATIEDKDFLVPPVDPRLNKQTKDLVRTLPLVNNDTVRPVNVVVAPQLPCGTTPMNKERPPTPLQSSIAPSRSPIINSPIRDILLPSPTSPPPSQHYPNHTSPAKDRSSLPLQSSMSPPQYSPNQERSFVPMIPQSYPFNNPPMMNRAPLLPTMRPMMNPPFHNPPIITPHMAPHPAYLQSNPNQQMFQDRGNPVVGSMQSRSSSTVNSFNNLPNMNQEVHNTSNNRNIYVQPLMNIVLPNSVSNHVDFQRFTSTTENNPQVVMVPPLPQVNTARAHLPSQNTARPLQSNNDSNQPSTNQRPINKCTPQVSTIQVQQRAQDTTTDPPHVVNLNTQQPDHDQDILPQSQDLPYISQSWIDRIANQCADDNNITTQAQTLHNPVHNPPVVVIAPQPPATKTLAHPSTSKAVSQPNPNICNVFIPVNIDLSKSFPTDNPPQKPPSTAEETQTNKVISQSWEDKIKLLCQGNNITKQPQQSEESPAALTPRDSLSIRQDNIDTPIPSRDAIVNKHLEISDATLRDISPGSIPLPQTPVPTSVLGSTLQASFTKEPVIADILSHLLSPKKRIHKPLSPNQNKTESSDLTYHLSPVSDDGQDSSSTHHPMIEIDLTDDLNDGPEVMEGSPAKRYRRTPPPKSISNPEPPSLSLPTNPSANTPNVVPTITKLPCRVFINFLKFVLALSNFSLPLQNSVMTLVRKCLDDMERFAVYCGIKKPAFDLRLCKTEGCTEVIKIIEGLTSETVSPRHDRGDLKFMWTYYPRNVTEDSITAMFYKLLKLLDLCKLVPTSIEILVTVLDKVQRLVTYNFQLCDVDCKAVSIMNFFPSLFHEYFDHRSEFHNIGVDSPAPELFPVVFNADYDKPIMENRVKFAVGALIEYFIGTINSIHYQLDRTTMEVIYGSMRTLRFCMRKICQRLLPDRVEQVRMEPDDDSLMSATLDEINLVLREVSALNSVLFTKKHYEFVNLILDFSLKVYKTVSGTSDLDMDLPDQDYLIHLEPSQYLQDFSTNIKTAVLPYHHDTEVDVFRRALKNRWVDCLHQAFKGVPPAPDGSRISAEINYLLPRCWGKHTYNEAVVEAAALCHIDWDRMLTNDFGRSRNTYNDVRNNYLTWLSEHGLDHRKAVECMSAHQKTLDAKIILLAA